MEETIFELLVVCEDSTPNPRWFLGAGDSTTGVQAELSRAIVSLKSF